MELIQKHFPDLTPTQKQQFALLRETYEFWNEKINVISRKDLDQFYERHVLHSLSIAIYYKFKPGQNVLDVGTGGGFPGIPLAILFPETNFHLVDSIGKKIKVVNEVVLALGLKNVKADQERVENLDQKYDVIITRAVALLSKLIKWIHNKIRVTANETNNSGIICLKGGDLTDELKGVKWQHNTIELKEYFEGEFFETKKIIHAYPK